MKKLFSVALVALTALCFSCSSDSDGSSSSANGQISANAGGTAWSSMDMPGGAVASVIEMNGQLGLQIMGMRMDESMLTIQFPIADMSEGTHTFSGEDADGLITFTDAAMNSYTSLDGGNFTLNITDFDLDNGRLSGTFSGILYDFEGNALELTNGVIDNILLIGQSLYSNGQMTLTRGANTFTMDDNEDDGRYLLIHQDTFTDSLMLTGNNFSAAGAGMYTLNFPADVAPGTYTLTQNGSYGAGLGSSDDQPEYTLTSGTLTITSHNGNTVVGTFSYTVSNGSNTVSITDGSFSITHN